ncbi:MAG: DUF1330 domain-containing protein [Ferruginibacter sp.]
MSAYLIFENLSIQNEEAINEHREKVTPLVEKYGGKYLVIHGKTKHYEGEWKPKELIIMEFPSFEKADEFYNSDDYKDLKALRMANSKSNGILVDGIHW